MLSGSTCRFFENRVRFARRVRGWRAAAIVPVALVTAATAAGATAGVNPLTPAAGQPHPSSLSASTPIPAVATAAAAAKRNARLPKAIIPSRHELEQENATGGGIIPRGCEPAFGSGVTGKVCRLGDTSSRRVVVELGDSQAGTWTPALVAVARAQHFAVVPLDKPGCFVSRLTTNLPGWPCASWYQWALARDKALHPVATLVMFLLSAPLQQHPSSTVSDMQTVLAQVPNGVYFADQPSQSQEPDECIYRSGANMDTCSSGVPSTYVPLMKTLERMTTQTHHPTIPTLQWFCAGGICPMIIDHTLTTRDRDHMTKQYSAELAPLLSLELRPILLRRKG
jgi:hypothetical protein